MGELPVVWRQKRRRVNAWDRTADVIKEKGTTAEVSRGGSTCSTLFHLCEP